MHRASRPALHAPSCFLLGLRITARLTERLRITLHIQTPFTQGDDVITYGRDADPMVFLTLHAERMLIKERTP